MWLATRNASTFKKGHHLNCFDEGCVLVTGLFPVCRSDPWSWYDRKHSICGNPAFRLGNQIAGIRWADPTHNRVAASCSSSSTA